MSRRVFEDRSARLLAEWRNQIDTPIRERPPRPYGAVTYLLTGPVTSGLVPIEDLVLLVMRDEPSDGSRPKIRVSGYHGAVVPDGAMFGGASRRAFLKDLSLCPASRGKGEQIGAKHHALLGRALQLDRHLEHLRGAPPYRHLALPKLWAAIAIADERRLQPQGPEIEWQAKRSRTTPGALLRSTRREHRGLALYPMDWLSHQGKLFVGVFADLMNYPRRQVFPTSLSSHWLRGFRGATQFDLFGGEYLGQLRVLRTSDRRISPQRPPITPNRESLKSFCP